MPAEQFRGMTRRKEEVLVKTKYKPIHAKKGIRNWSATATIDGKRYTNHGTRTRKPGKEELKQLRKTHSVRVLHRKHPQYGYRYLIMTSPVIGKYDVFIGPKAQSKKKKTAKAKKKRTHKSKRKYQKGFT